MIRFLLLLHHIAPFTSLIAPYRSRLMYVPYVIDHAETESEIKKEQVQGALGGPQASSYEDTNIVVIKASPDASNHHP
jgi:hypothetical protein